MGAFDQAAAVALVQQSSAPKWLEAFRLASQTIWLASAWPNRKTEDWKYTTLAPLTQSDYLRFGAGDSNGFDASLVEIPGLECQRLVFVNGEIAPELCQLKQSCNSNTMVRFSDADSKQQQLIAEHIGTVAATDRNPFVALNGSWLDDGVLFHVTEDEPLPLHIVHLTRPGVQPFSVRQRLLVVVGANANATVIEHFASSAESQSCFVNGVSEFKLDVGARLSHYRLQLEQQDVIHIGGMYTRLQRDASLDCFILGLGSQLKRLDLRVQHQGPGSDARINGVYLCKNSQHIDIHSTVEHEQPHGTTSEVVRGIVDDKARAVFNGRIHIHPDAQKSVAELSNRNLLLSDSAEVYTKPELEIYADDVLCAHGATVSQIEDMALYYLQSRGIDRKEAEVLLSFGFINELINNMGHEPLQQLLRPLLTSWFGHDPRLTRHLP